jgi:rhodanese-related sulfurtransferase
MLRLRTELFPRALFQAAVVLMLAALLALGANHFSADPLPLTADWSPAARLKSATGDSLVIPIEQAAAFHESREAVFVDARSPELFAEGHIAGAINVPWEQVDDYLDVFLKQVPDASSVVIVYCDGEGCSLSEQLALMLRNMGYPNVKVLVNGWTVWTTRGYPVETGESHEA